MRGENQEEITMKTKKIILPLAIGNWQLAKSKNRATNCILLIACCLLSISAFAQTIKRQCIASTGSYITDNGTTVQQTIGQPYGTTSYYSNKTRFNPGFQQPVYRIETIKSRINATVFPNPASNQITIETTVLLEDVTIQILDISGKLVLNENIKEFKNYSIDCSNWSNGTYLISLADSKNDLYSSKLIITR